jgi:hypothetical protein
MEDQSSIIIHREKNAFKKREKRASTLLLLLRGMMTHTPVKQGGRGEAQKPKGVVLDIAGVSVK